MKIQTKLNRALQTKSEDDKTMTFNEYISVVGFQDVFKYYGEWILDEATSESIYDYFYYRNICDDKKFQLYFQRNMKQYRNQYFNLLRNEHIEFDPMVTRYLERQVINKITSTGAENTTKANTNNTLITNGGTITIKTDNVNNENGNSTEQGNSSFNNTGSTNASSQHSGNENHQDRTRNILSVFPQANVGSNTSGSLDDNVSYNYATQMTDNKNKGDKQDTSNDSSNATSRENGTGSNTNNINSSNRGVFDGLQKQTNNSNSNKAFTENGNENVNRSGEENSDLKERLTGRENYDSAVLLEHAKNYIESTNAFRYFLIPKLEKCFIGNLRYEEE